MLDSLKQIRSALAVAQHKSFTRAAKSLHLSQSALTVQVRLLEDELGVRIFDRNQRSVVITSAGRQILPSLERLVMSADAVLENTHDIVNLRKGFITIATLPSIAAHLLPAALSIFRREHPHVQTVVTDVVASRVVQMVKSGEADLGITGDTAKDRELASELLLIDRLCAFVPREHAVACQEAVSLRELLAQPLILTGVDSSVRELITRKVRGETVALTPAYQVNYLSTALGFVEAGLGIAILPESSLNGNANPAIRTVPIEPIVRRHVTLIHRRGTEYSHAAAAFVECLKRKAGSEIAKLSSAKEKRKRTPCRETPAASK